MTLVRVAEGVDAGLPWHFGDPLAEQRRLDAGDGLVDLSNRDVLRVEGADRLTYLGRLATQRLDQLAPGQSAAAYLLDSKGRLLYDLRLVAAADAVWLWTEPGRGPALADWLEQRKFRLDVRAVCRPDYAVFWSAGPDGAAAAGEPDGWIVRQGADSLGGAEWFAPRADLPALFESPAESPRRAAGPLAAFQRASRAGVWAWEARRIAAGAPRIGLDTDERALPNELGVPSDAVSLSKGCYPGQETVARIHNLGQPQRQLVRLHLDGSAETFTAPGTPLWQTDGGTEPVGFVGSMAYHWQLGPIALALVQRTVAADAVLVAAGVACSVEPLWATAASRLLRPLPNLNRSRRRAGPLA
ncbi:MAG: folate-binding protein [Propionibacteriaceae bacterium]|jgi:folate-binding protein YgfZ|nr:folate-binding protein [Propionibacteriaceae bacterium]